MVRSSPPSRRCFSGERFDVGAVTDDTSGKMVASKLVITDGDPVALNYQTDERMPLFSASKRPLDSEHHPSFMTT